MKWIRECRFGPPKTFKTTAVVTSYPKPLFVANFDPGGLDAIPSKDITFLDGNGLRKIVSGEAPPPPVSAINYYSQVRPVLGTNLFRNYSASEMGAFIGDANVLLAARKLPFRTVVVDPLTQMSDAILEFVGALNNVKSLNQAQWGQVTAKTIEIVSGLTTLEAHVVFIAHELAEKDDLLGSIRIVPLAYGQARSRLGGLVSQFFYATTEFDSKTGQNRFVVRTKPQGNVTGVGARWPVPLPAVCGPLFADIYGSEENLK